MFAKFSTSKAYKNKNTYKINIYKYQIKYICFLLIIVLFNFSFNTF